MVENALNAAASQTLPLEPGGAGAGSTGKNTFSGSKETRSENNENNELCWQCWDKAFYAFATGYIFEKRANQRQKL